MKKERIKHIIHESVAEIGERCAAVGTNFDEEGIHKFRVAVKSLRSFLRLQKMYTADKKIKLTKKMKRLYDIAGVIREAQLELAFLEHKPELPHYTAQLRNIIILQQQEWKQRYSSKTVAKLDKKLAGYKFRKMQPEVLKHFFDNRALYIRQLAQSTAPTDIEIHDARKKIKDIIYIAKMADKQWKAARDENIPVKELDALSDQIGNYNDERTIIDHLRSLPTTNLGAGEKSDLKHLKDKEWKKLRKKRAAVLTATRSYNRTHKQ